MNIFEKAYLKLIKEDTDYHFKKDDLSDTNLSVKNDNIVDDLTANDNKSSIEALVKRLGKFEFPKVYQILYDLYCPITDENGYFMAEYFDDKNLLHTTYKDFVCTKKREITDIRFISYKGNTLTIEIDTSFIQYSWNWKVRLGITHDQINEEKGKTYQIVFHNIDENIEYSDLVLRFTEAFKNRNNISNEDIVFSSDIKLNKTLIYECGERIVRTNSSCGGSRGGYYSDNELLKKMDEEEAKDRKEREKARNEIFDKQEEAGSGHEKQLCAQVLFVKNNYNDLNKISEMLFEKSKEYVLSQVK